MTFLIAEIGVNHNGNDGEGRDLIAAATRARVDAVKFQAFTPERLAKHGSPKYDMLSWLRLSDDALRRMADYAAESNVEFMCTPFDCDKLDLVVSLGVKRLKLSSGSIADLDLVEGAAKTRLPTIISNGMCSDAQLDWAVNVFHITNTPLTILYCVSQYPAPEKEVHLSEMARLRARYPGLPIGYSDHTVGIFASVAAAAMGADVIEKHITRSCDKVGPDHRCSVEMWDAPHWVSAVRAAGESYATR